MTRPIFPRKGHQQNKSNCIVHDACCRITTSLLAHGRLFSLCFLEILRSHGFAFALYVGKVEPVSPRHDVFIPSFVHGTGPSVLLASHAPLRSRCASIPAHPAVFLGLGCFPPLPFPFFRVPIVSERRFGGWRWATPWDLSHAHGHFHPLFLGWSIPIPSMRNKCNGLAWPPPPPPAPTRGGSKRQGRRERVPGDGFTCTRTCWCRSCALLRLLLPVASSTSWPREACHSSAGLADASPTFPSTPGGLGASTRA